MATTSSAMKPIPTRYAGVLFRSRTEARWAKFWDQLDVKWTYETQGFATEGTPYLPDFVVWAAAGMLWAEVKGAWEADPAGIERWRQFAVWRPQPSRAVLLIGPPRVGEGTAIVIGGDEGSGDPLRGPWEDDTQEWRPCGGGQHFDLAYAGTFKARFAADSCPDDFGGNGEERLAKAVSAALSAKFGKGPE